MKTGSPHNWPLLLTCAFITSRLLALDLKLISELSTLQIGSGRKPLILRTMKPPLPYVKWRIASTTATVPPTSAIEGFSCQVSLVIWKKKWLGEDQLRICTYLHLNLYFAFDPVQSREWSLICIFFSLDTTQLNNLVESLTRYRNEPAYVSPTPSTMVIPSDQDFGQVYGQGDQGKL